MKIFLWVTGGLSDIVGGGWQTLSWGVIGFAPLCLYGCHEELLRFLGLIHVLPVKLAAGIVSLLSSILTCLAFYRASGPLGKMSSGGCSIELTSWLCPCVGSVISASFLLPWAFASSLGCGWHPSSNGVCRVSTGPVHTGCSAVTLLAVFASSETCLSLRPWFIVWLASYSSVDSGRTYRWDIFSWSIRGHEHVLSGSAVFCGFISFLQITSKGVDGGCICKKCWGNTL